MVSLVLGMLACVTLALVVMALVAVPARRAGRDVLSERGEEVLGSIRDRQRPGRFARTASTRPSRTRSAWAPAPEPPREGVAVPRPEGVGSVWFDGPIPEPTRSHLS